MARSCQCSGGACGGELNRREFLQTFLLGTAGMVFGQGQAGGQQQVHARKSGSKGLAPLHQEPPPLPSVSLQPPPPGLARLGQEPPATPRIYRGEHLEYLFMPIGGIGTGTVWLDGKGRLAVWQIFNNFTEERLPNAFFGIRLHQAGKKPLVRVLQTEAEPGFEPFSSLTYEGGYPIARLDFEDPAIPLGVRLEAFNPLIPLDTLHSSLPCAIFRWTVTNRSEAPLEVDLFGTLPYAQRGAETRFLLSSPRFPDALTSYPPGLLKVRLKTGAEVSTPPLLWLDRVGWSTENQPLEYYAQVVEAAAQLLNTGGTLLLVDPQPEFLRLEEPPWEVFEDFEKDSYEGWTVEGTAFGEAPHTGATPGQQPVSGFWGKRLVNTYRPDDQPQGRLTSKPFTIQKRYIGFLIGGGHHPGETCVNLRVGDKVVRTATGRNREQLEPHTWDVSELIGKEAVIEIVDHHSGDWGHINVDHFVFSDLPPESLFRLSPPLQRLHQALTFRFETFEIVSLGGKEPPSAHPPVQLTPRGSSLLPDLEISHWKFLRFVRLKGFQASKDWQVLAETGAGEPLLLLGKVGNAHLLLCLADQIPPEWIEPLLLAARGTPLGKNERLVSGHPLWGEVVLATDHASPRWIEWQTAEELQEANLRKPSLPLQKEHAPRSSRHGALFVPFRLKPGQSKTLSFILSWYYPNVERYGHPGNRYAHYFPDATAVARYVLQHRRALWEWTRLYHQTLYQSNLPPAMVDALTSQSVILRSPTCFWSEDGYFGGFEGSYGCCPLNCTHVWNYAQTHARLFPEIGRNMRESDLLVYLHADGETSHRQHAPHGAFIDGQCATIVAAYREHLTSPDGRFLSRVWEPVKKATEWLIRAIDPDEDGVPSGHQWNTYDCATSGATTFLGSQYLCALWAAEKMASLQGEPEAAQRYRRIRQAGMKNQTERLWNGEYFIQIPDPKPAYDYHTGCHSDQLLGQWWAFQLGLGSLYPPEHIRSALNAIFQYNFREHFRGFRQFPRRYVLDEEGGLLLCTWPHGGRPTPFIIYADEVWTGIEYAVAGLMLWMGLIEPALKIVETARGRYDGRRRDGLDSGPGGNPFNELECGKFYARAMSSFGLLLAAQGFILDGPAGILGFQPRWRPEDHRSFFVAAEGWGLFTQKRTETQQIEQIELRYGRLRLKQLVFALPTGFQPKRVEVRLDGKPVKGELKQEQTSAAILLKEELTLTAPAKISVRFQRTL